MKKIIITSGLFLFTLAVAHAQSVDAVHSDSKTIKKEKHEKRKELRMLEGKDVSNLSKQQFAADFPDVTDAGWSRAGAFDEAGFMQNNEQVTAYYDEDARLVGTTTAKQFSDLPLNGQKQISKKYKDYSVTRVIRFTDNEANETDMMLYDNQFEDENSYFAELEKGEKKFVLQVTDDGSVSYFAPVR